MTRVLPLPAAARMSSGPSMWVTASRWAGVRSASRSCSSGMTLPRSSSRRARSRQRRESRGADATPLAHARISTFGLYSGVRALLRSIADRNPTRDAEPVMEIVGIGTDIVECLRIGRLIEKHGEQFLARIYTERE